MLKTYRGFEYETIGRQGTVETRVTKDGRYSFTTSGQFAEDTEREARRGIDSLIRQEQEWEAKRND